MRAGCLGGVVSGHGVSVLFFEWLDLSFSPFSFSVLGLGRVMVHSAVNQSESVGDLGPSELFDAEMYTQLSVVQLLMMYPVAR